MRLRWNGKSPSKGFSRRGGAMYVDRGVFVLALAIVAPWAAAGAFF